MLINRNNYENFFLLYVDGELSVADRKVVEDFAAVNEDLQKELDILKETVLTAEDVLFESKGGLFRPVPIDALLQEKILFKIDNELAENEEASLNELIKRDENVGAEFALLQRTVLDADDTIVFADKQSLYRREKERPVVPIFWRWAAAAVLIGFGSFFGINLLQNKGSNEVAVAPVQGIKNNGVNDPQNINPAEEQSIASVTPNKQATIELPDNTNSSAQKATTTPTQKNGSQKEIKKEDQQNLVQDAPQPVLQKRNENNLPNKRIEPDVQLATVSQPKQVEIIDKPSIVPLNTEDQYARTASLTDNEKSGNKILYMDEDDVKRSKAGGFFRKVKRFVERTAKIKSGSTLQIAGFEFAAK
jgi:hypothetical protein